eukprot:548369-Heterocapsa_arctica.AAC.1
MKLYEASLNVRRRETSWRASRIQRRQDPTVKPCEGQTATSCTDAGGPRQGGRTAAVMPDCLQDQKLAARAKAYSRGGDESFTTTG